MKTVMYWQSSRRLIGVVTAAISFTLPPEAILGGDVQPAKNEVVSRLMESTSAIADCELRLTARVSVTSDKRLGTDASASPAPSVTDHEILFRRSGQRVLLSQLRRKPGSSGFQLDLIFDQGDLLHVQHRLEPDGSQPDSYQHLLVSMTSERIAGPQAKVELQDVLERPHDIGVVLGIVGYFPLAAYFESAENVVVTQDDRGELTQVSCSSPLGDLTLWLEPAHGHLPRKIRLTKAGSDLTSGGRSVQDIEMGGNATWPKGGVRSITWECDEIVFAQESGVNYLKEVSVVQSLKSVEGPTVTTTAQISVDQARFTPQFENTDFTPQLTIPEGHPVGVRFAENVPYQWRDGQVSAAIDH